MLILGSLAAFTVCILADSEKHFAKKIGKRLTYPELAAYVFPSVSFWGTNAFQLVIYAFITLTVMGVCGAYVIFISETLPLVVHDVTAVSSIEKQECFRLMMSSQIFMILRRSQQYSFLFQNRSKKCLGSCSQLSMASASFGHSSI